MDQSIITDLLPSKQLKEAIRSTGFSFSEHELLLIAEQYAPTRDQLLSALEYLAANCADSRQIVLAEERICYHREALDRMLTSEPDRVYAAEIREHPDSYTEHYLCKTYPAAVRAIENFREEYVVQFIDSSSIAVKIINLPPGAPTHQLPSAWPSTCRTGTTYSKKTE